MTVKNKTAVEALMTVSNGDSVNLVEKMGFSNEKFVSVLNALDMGLFRAYKGTRLENNQEETPSISQRPR